MRILSICVAALLLSGCVESDVQNAGGTLTSSAASSPRPKAIVVSDFSVDSDVLLIDRGYTARLERKIGAFPTFERKPRTIDRVNDEIVATIVATLREAGLEAAPGAEESMAASIDAVIVKGRLRPSDAGAKKNEAGIGGGKSNVTADMTMSKFSRFGKRDLMSFSAGTSGKLPSGKAATADNAAIAGVLAAGDGAKEKLSPDVEGAARKLGHAIGDKIVAYARAQGWLNQAGGDDAVAKPAEEKPAQGKTSQAKTSQAKTSQADAAHEDTGDKAHVSPLPGDEEPQLAQPAVRPKKKPAA